MNSLCIPNTAMQYGRVINQRRVNFIGCFTDTRRKDRPA
uniref:Uncharacterized protein n=1 Tax=Anguilla anguilla TaxID=7936 RepID=A0A0E9SZL8_ANGAN